MSATEPACPDCGACCAAFRVDFHREDLAAPGKSGVPGRMAVRLTPTLYRMRGTDEAPPRCVALEGEIGKGARCAIYPQRPGPCRDFAPYAPLGMGDDACDRARRRHGLPALGSWGSEVPDRPPHSEILSSRWQETGTEMAWRDSVLCSRFS